MRKYLHYHHDMCNPAHANKVRVDEARKNVPHFLVHFAFVFMLFNFIYVVHGFCLSQNQKKLENEKLCCFMSVKCMATLCLSIFRIYLHSPGCWMQVNVLPPWVYPHSLHKGFKTWKIVILDVFQLGLFWS